MTEGDYAQLRQEVCLLSPWVYWIFALGKELGAVEIYCPVLQTVCFVNVGCFSLLALLSWL